MLQRKQSLPQQLEKSKLNTGSMPRVVQAFSYILPCLLLFTQEPMMFSPILLASNPFKPKTVYFRDIKTNPFKFIMHV